MIPPAPIWRASIQFLAKRLGVPVPGRAVVDSMRDFALSLAVELEEEPAALFTSVAAHRRDIPKMWRTLAAVVAMNHPAALGMRLRARPAELEALRTDVARGAASYPEVREWFAERLTWVR